MNSKLKGYRVMAGYTQEAMAQLIRTSRPAFNMKENGNLKFSVEEERVIYQALKQKLPDLKKQDVFPVLDD